jgi:hypothetical protein
MPACVPNAVRSRTCQRTASVFFNLTGPGEPEEVRAEGVSANLFAVPGVGAAQGRFHADPGVLGLGIMPASSSLPPFTPREE